MTLFWRSTRTAQTVLDIVAERFGGTLPRLHQAPPAPPELEVPERVVREAGQIDAPVLFHVPWDDELFPRDGQFSVFDAFGSAEKELIAVTGGHAETKPSAVARWREFVIRHLQ